MPAIAPGSGQIDRVLHAEPGWVNDEHRARPVSAGPFEGVRVCVFERVPDRTELEPDEVVESVAAVRRGGESEPVPGGDGAHG